MRTFIYRFLFICFVAFVFSSCERPHPALRIATNIWPGYEMLYLARNLGYYNDVPIRLLEVSSTSTVTRGIRNGTIEAGCMTLDEALTLLQDSIDIRIILVMDESRGADVLMVKPEIKSLKDLKGKRIGLENSTMSAILLDAAMRKAGLKIGDVELVPSPVDHHYDGFVEDKYDAIATFEPVRSLLLEKGAKILYSSADMPGKILDVFVVRADAIETHSMELEKVLVGYFEALSFYRHFPEKASKYMERRLGKDPLSQFKGIHMPSVTENKIFLNGDSARIYKISNEIASVMIDRKLLRRSAILKNFVESKFLPVK